MNLTIVELEQVHHSHQVQDGDCFVSTRVTYQGKRLCVPSSSRMPTSRYLFTQTFSLFSRLLSGARFTSSSHCVLAFRQLSGLHQGVHSGYIVSSPEEDTSPLISGQLVSDCRVGFPPPLILKAAASVSGHGDCHHLGEVRPRAFQHRSVS